MLDKIDCSILELLQHDAKLTNKEIADKLGKTTTPIFERIKKLENENVIIKYMAIVNREKVGKHLVAFTNVQLKEHSQSMILAFEKNIVLGAYKGGGAIYLLEKCIAYFDNNIKFFENSVFSYGFLFIFIF